MSKKQKRLEIIHESLLVLPITPSFWPFNSVYVHLRNCLLFKNSEVCLSANLKHKNLYIYPESKNNDKWHFFIWSTLKNSEKTSNHLRRQFGSSSVEAISELKNLCTFLWHLCRLQIISIEQKPKVSSNFNFSRISLM